MFIWRLLFFFKQKTAYEMRISDWSSDVCSSDLRSRDSTASHTPKPNRPSPSSATTTLASVKLRGRSGERGGGVAGTQQSVRRGIGRASCRDRVCQYG